MAVSGRFEIGPWTATLLKRMKLGKCSGSREQEPLSSTSALAKASDATLPRRTGLWSTRLVATDKSGLFDEDLHSVEALALAAIEPQAAKNRATLSEGVLRRKVNGPVLRNSDFVQALI